MATRILFTGAAGRVGRETIAKLKRAAHEAFSIRLDYQSFQMPGRALLKRLFPNGTVCNNWQITHICNPKVANYVITYDWCRHVFFTSWWPSSLTVLQLSETASSYIWQCICEREDRCCGYYGTEIFGEKRKNRLPTKWVYIVLIGIVHSFVKSRYTSPQMPESLQHCRSHYSDMSFLDLYNTDGSASCIRAGSSSALANYWTPR